MQYSKTCSLHIISCCNFILCFKLLIFFSYSLFIILSFIIIHLTFIIYKIEDIIKNARKVAMVISPQTGRPLEVDFWIPDLQLAFEFQVPYYFFIFLFQKDIYFTVPTIPHLIIISGSSPLHFHRIF